jgi:hypothetical protein
MRSLMIATLAALAACTTAPGAPVDSRDPAARHDVDPVVQHPMTGGAGQTEPPMRDAVVVP